MGLHRFIELIVRKFVQMTKYINFCHRKPMDIDELPHNIIKTRENEGLCKKGFWHHSKPFSQFFRASSFPFFSPVGLKSKILILYTDSCTVL